MEMSIVLVNRGFERLGPILNANVIWASRYYKCGDFQITVPATTEFLKLLAESYFIVNDEDKDNVGIIEDYVIKNTKELGDQITITGRFSPMILGKRIIAEQTQLNGYVQNGIRNLIKTNVINPTKTARKISCVELGAYNEEINEKLKMQITGDNLLTKIEEIAETFSIGFKMPLRKGKFYFELYKGVDRSYKQIENPWVIFSDEYDNLTESEYVYYTTDFKNVFLIATEGEGLERKKLWGATNDNETEITDLDRNEVYVDQRNMSSNEEDITEKEYYEQMNLEGKDNLTTITQAFSGKVMLNNYKYGKPENGGDFFLGDIVTIKNSKWGIYINARIVEVIENQTSEGRTLTLTFGI